MGSISRRMMGERMREVEKKEEKKMSHEELAELQG